MAVLADAHPEWLAKLEAIKAYRSQWVSMYQLVPIITVKSFLAGLRYGHRWSEVFYQIR